MKNFLRAIIFYGCLATFSDGEFECKPNTLKFKFLNWLYDGDCEEQTDGWIYPEK